MLVSMAEEDEAAQNVGGSEGAVAAKNEAEGGSAETKQQDNSEALMEELLMINEQGILRDARPKKSIAKKKKKGSAVRRFSRQGSEMSANSGGLGQGPVSSLFNEHDPNVRTMRYNGATIRLLAHDLKSRKNLIGKNAEILFAKESMGRYIGKMVKGLPHGYGVKTWPDGKKYQGNW